MDNTLTAIVQALEDGLSPREVAQAMQVEEEWVMLIMGTDGFSLLMEKGDE